MRPILECASIPDLHGFDHDIQLRGRTPGNPADSLHCTKLDTRKCRMERSGADICCILTGILL